jgi:3-hydroxyacyl-[acyl-carrier-protein] dehydratase
MLKDNLFTITEKKSEDNNLTYHISFDNSHPIFAAHFPGNPVLPGACIIQIIKELTEEFYEKSLFLGKIKNTKFLNTINPLINNEIEINLNCKAENDEITVSATVHFEETIFSKTTLCFSS